MHFFVAAIALMHIMQDMMDKTYFEHVEKAVRDSGLTMAEFYAMAGIHQTTWMRWKKGQGYHSSSKYSVDRALEEIEQGAMAQ